VLEAYNNNEHTTIMLEHTTKIMRHGAAHPTATGALLDHHGADHEWLHLQCHDVLEDGDSPHLRPSPLIHQLRPVFKRLHVDEEAHHLDVVVLQQLSKVGSVGCRPIRHRVHDDIIIVQLHLQITLHL